MTVKRWSVGVDGPDEKGSLVKYTDYAALEEKLKQVAAENAALKKFCENAAFDADFEAGLGMEIGGFTDALNDIKTPATDAAINEIKLSALSGLSEEIYRKIRAGIISNRRRTLLDFAWAEVEAEKARLKNNLLAGGAA